MSDTTNQIEEPNQSLNQVAAAKKPGIQPLVLVSGILTTIVALITIVELSGLPAGFEWALSGLADLLIRPWAYILADLLAPVLAILAAYIGLVKREVRMHAAAVTAAYLVPGAIYTFAEVLRYLFVPGQFSGLADIPYFLRNFVPFIWGGQSFEHELRLSLFIFIVVIAWIAVAVSKGSGTRNTIANRFGVAPSMTNQQPIGYDPQTGAPIYGQPAQAQPIGYDPQTGAPIYGQPAQAQPIGYDPQTGAPIYQPVYMRPESQLPLVALIGGILFPLLGIIVGHIALSQMKRGEIPSSNMGLAKTGLILGYSFMALGFVALFIYIALFAAIVGPGFDF